MAFVRETLELHGAYPDLIPQDAPEEGWNNAHNVYFENGETKRIKGDTLVYGSPSTAPKGLVFHTDGSGNPYWVYAGPDGVFVTDGSTHTDITPTAWGTPSDDSIYTLSSFNGLVSVNNSSVGPFYWNGDPADVCEPLPDWPTGGRCIAMRPHRAFLFAIGMTTEGGFQRVRWSDAAEAGAIPAAWTPAADNLAGFVDLMPSYSPCLDGATLRDSFLIFKGEAVFALTFVGGNNVFASRLLFSSVGIAGTNGWTDGPNEQLIFAGSDGDVHITDGARVDSALEGKARRSFEAECEPELHGKLAAATLRRTGHSWIFYPTVGEDAPNKALVYNWRTGEVSFRDASAPIHCVAAGRYLQDVTLLNQWEDDANSWDDDKRVWDFAFSPATKDEIIAGVSVDAAAKMMAIELEEAEDFNGEPVTAYAQKAGLAFGDAMRRKLVSRIWPKLYGSEGDVVKIRAGGQDISGGTTHWSKEKDFVIGQTESVDLGVCGRFIALEVYSQGGGAWRLGTVDVEYRYIGRF